MIDPKEQPVGWTDESDPCGIGYRIMTEKGLETYDIGEYIDYRAAVERVQKYIESKEIYGTTIKN
jgi:hypothetical protein